MIARWPKREDTSSSGTMAPCNTKRKDWNIDTIHLTTLPLTTSLQHRKYGYCGDSEHSATARHPVCVQPRKVRGKGQASPANRSTFRKTLARWIPGESDICLGLGRGNSCAGVRLELHSDKISNQRAGGGIGAFQMYTLQYQRVHATLTCFSTEQTAWPY
jgi:hypothetical protein